MWPYCPQVLEFPFLSFLVNLTPTLQLSGPAFAPWFQKLVWIFKTSKEKSSITGCQSKASCQNPRVWEEMGLCSVLKLWQWPVPQAAPLGSWATLHPGCQSPYTNPEVHLNYFWPLPSEATLLL